MKRYLLSFITLSLVLFVAFIYLYSQSGVTSEGISETKPIEEVKRQKPSVEVRTTSDNRTETLHQSQQSENLKRVLTQQDLIIYALTDRLKRNVSSQVTYQRDHEDWRIMCGRPTEVSGDSFDYSRSPLKQAAKEGLIDDKFCALFSKKGKRYNLIEFDLGSTDSPIMDWYVKYNLPKALLK